MINRITSEENKTLKKIKRLYLKKYRDSEGEYLAEGMNSAREAVINNADIDDVVVREDFILSNSANAALLNDLESRAHNIISVPEKLFNKLSDSETPQGILITVKKTECTAEDFYAGNNYIVLDRLQDPGNIGTILRTADAAGYAGALIVRGTADVYSPKIVRAAAGSLFRVPMRFTADAASTLKELRHYGKRVICTMPDADVFYCNTDLSHDAAVVIGNEAGGAGREFVDNSDIRIKIPMFGAIESLNAAVAAAIIMYESVRQTLDY